MFDQHKKIKRQTQILIQMTVAYPFNHNLSPNIKAQVKQRKFFNHLQYDQFRSKIDFHSKIKHPNIIKIIKGFQSKKEGYFDIFFEYVPHNIRNYIKMLTPHEIEISKANLLSICTYLICYNIYPEISELNIGFGQNKNIKLFLPIEFNKLTIVNRNELIKIKEIQINHLFNLYLISTQSSRVVIFQQSDRQSLISSKIQQNNRCVVNFNYKSPPNRPNNHSNFETLQKNHHQQQFAYAQKNPFSRTKKISQIPLAQQVYYNKGNNFQETSRINYNKNERYNFGNNYHNQYNQISTHYINPPRIVMTPPQNINIVHPIQSLYSILGNQLTNSRIVERPPPSIAYQNRIENQFFQVKKPQKQQILINHNQIENQNKFFVMNPTYKNQNINYNIHHTQNISQKSKTNTNNAASHKRHISSTNPDSIHNPSISNRVPPSLKISKQNSQKKANTSKYNINEHQMQEHREMQQNINNQQEQYQDYQQINLNDDRQEQQNQEEQNVEQQEDHEENQGNELYENYDEQEEGNEQNHEEQQENQQQQYENQNHHQQNQSYGHQNEQELQNNNNQQYQENCDQQNQIKFKQQQQLQKQYQYQNQYKKQMLQNQNKEKHQYQQNSHQYNNQHNDQQNNLHKNNQHNYKNYNQNQQNQQQINKKQHTEQEQYAQNLNTKQTVINKINSQSEKKQEISKKNLKQQQKNIQNQIFQVLNIVKEESTKLQNKNKKNKYQQPQEEKYVEKKQINKKKQQPKINYLSKQNIFKETLPTKNERELIYDHQSLDTYHQELGQFIEMPKMIVTQLRQTTKSPPKIRMGQEKRDKLHESVGLNAGKYMQQKTRRIEQQQQKTQNSQEYKPEQRFKKKNEKYQHINKQYQEYENNNIYKNNLKRSNTVPEESKNNHQYNIKKSKIQQIPEEKSRENLYRMNFKQQQNDQQYKTSNNNYQPDYMYKQTFKIQKDDPLTKQFNNLFQGTQQPPIFQDDNYIQYENNQEDNHYSNHTQCNDEQQLQNQRKKFQQHEQIDEIQNEYVEHEYEQPQYVDIQNRSPRSNQINQRVKMALQKSEATLEYFNKFKKANLGK